MTHLLVAGLASAAAFLIWFALAREYVERRVFPYGIQILDWPPTEVT